MSVTIISGSPGCGKTSLSRHMAREDSCAAHIETDHFFRFLPHRIDPSTPESKAQNEMIVRSYATTAQSYSAAGYTVYLDGVIGPWLFPIIAPILGPLEFVLLHAPLEVTLSRISSRNDQGSARPSVAGRMHEQFSRTVSAYADHVISTNEATIEEIAREFHSRQSSGVLSIDDS